MKQTHTRRDKGRALFLAALMVLSVFAMSASFAGAAAADATGVQVDDVDLADEDSVDAVVTHNENDEEVAIALRDDAGDLQFHTVANTEDGESTTFNLQVNSTGNYTVYAEAGAENSTDAESLDDANNQASDSFEVSDSTPEEQTGDDSISVDTRSLVWQGQELESSEFGDGEDVQLREGTEDDPGTLVSQLSVGNDGVVSFSSDDLDGQYILVGDDGDGTEVVVAFEVAEQTMDAEWNDESVEQGGNATLSIDSNRASYVVNVVSDDLSQSDIASMFGADDDSYILETDDGIQVHHSGDTELTANFDGVDVDEYEFTVSAIDTTAEDTATISVEEETEASAQFDSSTYSQNAGDIVEFTVEMDDTDSTVVSIEDDGGNYWADLHVTADDGEDEVTVSFNTFQAGQDDSQEDNDAFSAENGSVEVLDQRDFTEEDGEDAEYRLLPSDLNLELYLASQDEVDNLEEDDDDRLDLSDLNEVDVATLVLNEGWTGDASTAVAPADADISDVDELHEVSTAGSAVAEDDQLIIGVEVSGVFGYLDGLDENELGDYLGLEIEQSNPAQYDSPNEIDDFEVIEDSENDQIFFVINTEDEGLEAGEEYDVTFTVEGDYVEYYTDHDDDEEATTAFSVVDREIEVTGDFDDEEILQIGNSSEANVTGESTAAPGTDVQVRLRATGEDPFLMSQTVQVNDDGTIDAEFDLSEYKAGQDFTVRMTDQNGDDVRHQVDAILTESHEGQTPHSIVIHVEDADGNAVSGAEISVDGETATTDDKGKAILELHHGEYKVSASYDGVEANGKLTVDDHSPDEIRLTLGEEDVDYNEKAKDDEKDADDKDADDKDADDEKDADDGDDDDAGAPADDQPGFGIAVAILALLAAAGFALRRQ